MKNLFVIVIMLVFAARISFAQEYVPWESYYWHDTLSWNNEFNYEEHHSIQPRINNRRVDFGDNKDKSAFHKQFHVLPMIDFVGGQTFNDFQHRTGAGFALDYLPIRGMHIKMAYVGGLANTNTINYRGGVYPFSIVRKPIESSDLFQYHDIRGRISYSPNKYFNFQAGIDNNRLGEGDRSLLLDEYGTPYPFAQMRIKLWRFEYVSMHTYLQNPNSSFTSTLPKFSALHYLSMNLFKGFNLSFFEAIIYDGRVGDQSRGFEFEYLNPFVIYRPIEFTLGSTDKVQMGLNLSYRLTKNTTIYGQAMIDEFRINQLRERKRNIVNKFGFQLGAKGGTAVAGGKMNWLSEFNLVRPYTYSHANPGQAFSNMSNPLAHPLGANFIENTSRIIYFKNRWDYSVDFVYYMRGEDFEDGVGWGSDINMSYNNSPVDADNQRIMEGFFIGSGNKTNVAKIHLGIGYQVLPKYRTRAFITLESLWFTQNQAITYYQGFFIGLRTELWNDRRNY